MRININMDEGLVKEIDIRAEKLFVSRSAYISMKVAQCIENEKVLSQLPELTIAMQKVADMVPPSGSKKED